MASLPIGPQAVRTRPFWAGMVVFAALLLAAALAGLSPSGATTVERTPVQVGYAAAPYGAGCHQLAARVTAIELHKNNGGCKAPVSCPASGAACCGTTCHAAADQVEGARLYPPAPAADAVGSAVRLQVEAARPGMFRPPIG